MTDSSETAGTQPGGDGGVQPGSSGTPSWVPGPVGAQPAAQEATAPATTASATATPATAASATADRPEIAVGAAFAGGLLLALILKRLAR